MNILRSLIPFRPALPLLALMSFVATPSIAGHTGEREVPILLDDRFRLETRMHPGDIRILPDGRIELREGNRLVRLRSDGSVESEVQFEVLGSPHSGAPFEQITSAWTLPDGTILAGVYHQSEREHHGAEPYSSIIERPILRRFFADGSVDESFTETRFTGYRFPTSINTGQDVFGVIDALAVQDDGKILVGGIFTRVGSSRKNIARFHSDGTLDRTFDPGSGATSSRSPMAFCTIGGARTGSIT